MERKTSAIKKVLKISGMILSALLIFLCSLLSLSIRWMFQTWNNLSMNELVFHLKAPLEGTNEGMIREYILQSIVPSLLILTAVIILVFLMRKSKKRFICSGAAVLILAVFSAGFSVLSAWNRLNVGGYLNSQGTYSSFIDENYVSPGDVKLTFPDRKRNLIYIFLESMEMTYTDKESGGAFDRNVIPELTVLARENEDFAGGDNQLNGGYSLPGSTWTMGAMFAQTSGLPLNISIDGNDMDTQETFFPGITTLGDILKAEGYSQTLMIGSDAVFGGRELYFTEHGGYEIEDYGYAVQNGMIPEDYRVWWGYEDQKLFVFAKDKLTELAAANQPFNLTLLTADTHFEDGYVCDICPDDFEDEQYANVMACSSRQIDEFVKWVKAQDFYENTTIVLAGDHPTMDSDFCEDVGEDYGRRVYIAFINGAAEKETETRRTYSTFDIFPTTLAALGVEIENDRLGLGTNLYSDAQTLTERFGTDTESAELEKKSHLMEQIANIDETSRELLQREGKPSASIEAEEHREDHEISVTVSEITGVQGKIQTVSLAVWTDEEQKDIQWIELDKGGGGKYLADIDLSAFMKKNKIYHIHVYAINKKGNQYLLGGIDYSIP